MGMGFEACLAGLNGCSKALDVASNNIANSNTVGFKTQQVNFADVFGASLTGLAPSQAVGLGGGVSRVVGSFTQGDIRQTNNPLDMAINGKGYFRLDDGGRISYSRNGEFHIEGLPFSEGTTPTAQQLREQQLELVNNEGLGVTGYLADYASDIEGIINSTGAPQRILIDSFVPGKETTSISAGFNLDASVGTPSAVPFDPNNSGSFNHSTSLNAFYEGGVQHDLTLSFVHTASPAINSWDMHVLDSGRAVGNIDLGAMTVPISIPAGDEQFTISIDGNAVVDARLAATSYSSMTALQAGIQSAIDVAIGQGKATVSLDSNNHLVVSSSTFGTDSSVTINGGTSYFGVSTTNSGQDLVRAITFDTSGHIDEASRIQSLDFGTGTPISLDLGSTTQYASAFAANASSQNGYSSGQLVSLSVGNTGIIQASYTNGLIRNAAEVVLATFHNPSGLLNIGNNQWIASSTSGAEQLDTPGNKAAGSLGMGLINGAAVENANVDLNEELVNLIIQQRNYQANAQALKTQDQILQTLASIR